MSHLKNIFRSAKPCIVGMIHVKALPGTPNSTSKVNMLIEEAMKEAEIYKSCHLDSVLIENMHDVPYVQSQLIGPEIIATMTRICSEVRRFLPLDMSCGVQILAGANKEAIAVAQAANLEFIRAEGYIYSHVADEGLMNSCAGELLRYRKNIGAEDICIFTDIKKKHCSHSLTNDVTLEETAKAAEFFLSDGVVLTGRATGDPANVGDLKSVRKACSIPVLIGSGVTADNISHYLEADAIIIGSYFKRNGDWKNEVDKERVIKFMKSLSAGKEKKFKKLNSSTQPEHESQLQTTEQFQMPVLVRDQDCVRNFEGRNIEDIKGMKNWVKKVQNSEALPKV